VHVPESNLRITSETDSNGADHSSDTWRLQTETALSDFAADTGTLAGLVRILSEAIGATVFLLSPPGKVISKSSPTDAPSTSVPTLERLHDAAGQPSLGSPAKVVRVPDKRSVDHDYILAPVSKDDHLFGWIVASVNENSCATDFLWAVGRAVVHLRADFGAQRRLARVAWNARANLARHMVRSTSYDADLRACAEYLGVDLAANRIIAFLLERGRPSDSAVDIARLGDFVASDLDVDVLTIRGTEGGILSIEVPRDIDSAMVIPRCKGAIVRGLDRTGDRLAVAGISQVTQPGQLRRAYREAFEAARCLDRYPSESTRAIACDELGPARLLVANSDERSVRTYVYDILGTLIAGGTSNNELLRTLQSFFESGRSIRETATLLEVHENTVRHRLGRVRDLTGLDVAGSSNDQLSVQTALVILRLQGHHAVPGFDPTSTSCRM
jgi:hypothetical protein